MNQYIDIHPKVLAAIRAGEPVVALESTIIAHGMPYPKNVETALSVEKIVAQNGATPATIAIIDGRIKVGLTPSELTLLGKQQNVLKLSKRDLAYCVIKKYTGATTVSATILIADMVGIRIFATGGIGGVHKNASETFDISRDLEEIADKQVAVISTGAKAILDLPKTLEYLETKGVEVIGYQTSDFPAFFSNESGLQTTYQLDEPKQIAELMLAKWSMGLSGGVLIANPIPESYAIDKVKLDDAITSAILAANAHKITGKDLTPYLLKHLQNNQEITSLESNIGLIYNNAKVAALIAVSFSKL